MDVNQRLDKLDEEVMVLKNQVHNVLLDIREHVLTSTANPFQSDEAGLQHSDNASPSAPPQGLEWDQEKQPTEEEASGNVAAEGQESMSGEKGEEAESKTSGEKSPAAELESLMENMRKEREDLERARQEMSEPSSGPETAQPGNIGPGPGAAPAQGSGPGPQSANYEGFAGAESASEPGELDLATLIRLMRWAEKGVRRIGKQRMEVLLDLYEASAYLPATYKETLSRMVALISNGAQGNDEERAVPMRDYVTTLIELDGLLGGRYQDQAQLYLSLIDDGEEQNGWTNP